MSFEALPTTVFTSTPWIEGSGHTRELAVSGRGLDPVWRLLHGSTNAGGTWERLPPTYEGLVIGVGGPRTEVLFGGVTHRLSNSRASLIAPGATIRVDRNGSSRRSDMVLLTFDAHASSGELSRRVWEGDVNLRDEDVAIVVLDGNLHLDETVASKGTVVRLRDGVEHAWADGVTAVVASIGPAE